MDDKKNLVGKNIGITSNVIVDRLGLKGYSMIANAGFNAIDFNMQRGFFISENNAFPINFNALINAHKQEIANSGLLVSQIHAPYYTSESNMNCPYHFERYLDTVEQALWASTCLGSKRFVIHPLHRYSWMTENEYELTEKLIYRLSSIAIKEEVDICIENLPYLFCGDYKRHLEFINLISDFKIKACFDTGHSKLCKKDPLQHLVALRDYIYAVHIHDNDGISDLHNRIKLNSNEWQMIINEMNTNENIISLSLETSGIYKKCDEDKIQNELILDFESISSYVKVE